MDLNFRPLLSALTRNPTGALLVTLQVAITLAVLVNASWIVHQRIHAIEQPTGIDTRDTFVIAVGGSSKQFNIASAESEDLAYVRSLPAVVGATVLSGIPLTGDGQETTVWRHPDERGRSVETAALSTDTEGLKTLGVSLIAGRDFRSDEIQPYIAGKQTPPPAEIIITESLARALFPHGSALGKTVYNGEPKTIIGIVHDFMGPQLGAPVYNTVLKPEMPGQFGKYTLLVRTRPGRRDALMHAVKAHIAAAHRLGVVVFTHTLAHSERRRDSANRNVAILLATITALMLAVCCLGVFGLTTFNVGSRTRQIGTYRALGARRRDVASHFLLESAFIMGLGALFGSVLALMISNWLTSHYALPRLDLAYLMTGIIALSAVGELAAWQPARRAARIPPSIATRTI